MIRQLRSILILPFMATVVIPIVLARFFGKSSGRQLGRPYNLIPLIAGVSLLAAGLTLIVKTVQMFIQIGRGTLAPWDPPKKLVVEGVYRHVRNPMISGVGLVLLGEASILGSFPHLIWFLLFAIVNAIYMPLSEEPGLLKRFGSDYEIYKQNVPRWIPRLTPWSQASDIYE